MIDFATDVPVLLLNFVSGNYKEPFVAFSVATNFFLFARATIYTFFYEKFENVLDRMENSGQGTEQDQHSGDYVTMGGSDSDEDF